MLADLANYPPVGLLRSPKYLLVNFGVPVCIGRAITFGPIRPVVGVGSPSVPSTVAFGRKLGTNCHPSDAARSRLCDDSPLICFKTARSFLYPKREEAFGRDSLQRRLKAKARSCLHHGSVTSGLRRLRLDPSLGPVYCDRQPGSRPSSIPLSTTA